MQTTSLSNSAIVVSPGSFEMENHFYTRVLNAQLHPLVAYFLNLGRENIIHRYCHLHPKVDRSALREILSYHPRFIPWAGADLFHVTTAGGIRHMIVIETNSCPSGQKSMPFNDHQELGGYRMLLEKTFLPMIQKNRRLPGGKLAVIYDKNFMEASGYAAALADLMDEDVLLASFYDGDPNAIARFCDGVLEVKSQGQWHPIRAAFRYVTQRPWNRIPLYTKTLIINPIMACIVGGRNKMVASKAYELYNADLHGTGLEIYTPETIRDVHKAEIPLWVRKFGGHAVVKNPYSNAGQGVFTITNEKELAAFMDQEHPYELFIVQSLIGNYQWSTTGSKGKFYHVGTVPNRQQKIYIADIRMMVCAGEKGFCPLVIYSRRSRVPLSESLDSCEHSWDMLGTNLSIRREDGSWDSDTNRLLLMDRRDFNKLGIGLDDLIEAYIQTVLAVTAIDKMAKSLTNQKGKFRKKLFRSLDNDDSLLNEIQI